MYQSQEFTEIMQSIAAKSLELSQASYAKPQEPAILIEQFMQLTKDYQEFLAKLLTNPENLLQMQVDYWQQSMQLVNESMTNWMQGTASTNTDKRFKHKEWQTNPFFNLLSQQYLLATKHIQQLVSSVEQKDKATAKKFSF